VPHRHIKSTKPEKHNWKSAGSMSPSLPELLNSSKTLLRLGRSRGVQGFVNVLCSGVNEDSFKKLQHIHRAYQFSNEGAQFKV
jgi:hypothetical protein